MNEIDEWRPRSTKAFEDISLSGVYHTTGQREVFDYHFIICDMIHMANENRIVTTVSALARKIFDDHTWLSDSDEWSQSRMEMFTEMRSHALIFFDGTIESVHQKIVISLPDSTYERWHLQFSKRARAKKQERDNHGKFLSKTPAKTVDHREHPYGDGNGTVMDPQRDRLRERERERDRDIGQEKKRYMSKPVPDLDAPSPKIVKSANETIEVFDHWKTATKRNESVKLTEGRKTKIKARLANGYSVADLCKAIDAFAADPFHRGENDSKTAYLDIPTILRSDEKVDAGLALADKHLANRMPGQETEVSEYDGAINWN